MDCESCGCLRAKVYDAPTRFGVRSYCLECHDRYAIDAHEGVVDDLADDSLEDRFYDELERE